MSRLKPYPKYKPSGVEWIGEIPEGWEAKRLKQITSLAYGDSLSNEDRIPGEVLVFGSNGVVGQHIDSNTKGNTIIVGRKGSFGKITFSDESCFAIDTTYYIDKSNTKNDIRWLYYLLICLRLDEISKDSAVPGLSRDEAYENYCPLPSLTIQRQIATYLNHETSRIDALISKKQQQIELLKEKRTALITRAVTKGLDPHAKMKPSGIEWIGDVPDGWEVKRLRNVTQSIRNGTTQTQQSEGTTNYAVSRIETISKGEINFEKIGYINEFDNMHDYLLKKGDILFSHINSMEYVGNCALYDDVQPLYNGMNVLCIRPKEHVNIYWMHYWMKSDICRHESKRMAKPAINQVSLPMNSIKDLLVIEPPIDVQAQISKYLDIELSKIDRLMDKVNQSINLLREYRTALITAVVTGKVEV